MERWAGKVAIVTGASVGLGAAVAKRLVGNQMKVIGCARDVDKMQELAKSLGPNGEKLFLPIKCDVSKEEDIKNVFKVAQEKYGGVHVLINNAGLAIAKSLLDMSAQEMHTQMDVNVIGLTLCAKEAINQMRQNGVDDGHIINISSVAGHRVSPQVMGGFYSATKHAVTALNICLKNEVSLRIIGLCTYALITEDKEVFTVYTGTDGIAVPVHTQADDVHASFGYQVRALGSHIRVSQISPGIIETEFAQRALNNPAANAIFQQLECLKPEDVTDTIVFALSAPAHVGVHDLQVLPVEENYVEILKLPETK